ncbi:MAG TPA: isoprenylcysteine carboxylmethyltransferase family protein [bacterium]|nr:isoprenylcysteine carboxylmethyltransferase family protein [bacterium]
METPEYHITWKTVVMLVVALVILPILPILITGRWDWWQAWAYAAATMISFAASRAVASKKHPGILKERAESLEHKDTKSFDKVAVSLLTLLMLAQQVVAGLDGRYRWSPRLGPAMNIAALVLIILGYAFASWALVENMFFSGTVRIQTERGHSVVSTGPYRLVRHPGYAGSLLSYVAIPLLFDSLWTYIPCALLFIILVVRAALEDRTLRKELPGYEEYTHATRWRLMPGIW